MRAFITITITNYKKKKLYGFIVFLLTTGLRQNEPWSQVLNFDRSTASTVASEQLSGQKRVVSSQLKKMSVTFQTRKNISNNQKQWTISCEYQWQSENWSENWTEWFQNWTKKSIVSDQHQDQHPGHSPEYLQQARRRTSQRISPTGNLRNLQPENSTQQGKVATTQST